MPPRSRKRGTVEFGIVSWFAPAVRAVFPSVLTRRLGVLPRRPALARQAARDGVRECGFKFYETDFCFMQRPRTFRDANAQTVEFPFDYVQSSEVRAAEEVRD